MARLRALFRRLRRTPAVAVYEGATEAFAAELRALPAGWISDEQRDAQTWYTDTLQRDLERLDAICDRLVLHRLRVVCEQAIRELLPPEERAWTRVHTGEYELAGVA